MATVTCPKCGNRQEGGDDCENCGIVFARYEVPEEVTPSAILPVGTKQQNGGAGGESGGLFRKLIKLSSWAALVIGVVFLFLILKPAAPPDIDQDPASAKRVEAALKGADRAARRNRPYTLAMNEADLNYWLQKNLDMGENPGQGAVSDVQKRAVNLVTGGALAKIPSQIGGEAAGAGKVAPPGATPPINQMQPTLREVRSAVSDIRINLSGDEVQAYLLFEVFGKDLTLELEGRLVTQDGYLRMEPTAGRIGSFSIPAVVLNSAVSRLFDAPDSREQFRLDDSISGIRIENGQLIVQYR